MSEIGSNREANRLFCAWRQTREIRQIGCRTRALRFASSAQAPRHAGIFRSLQIVGKHYRLCGGEGGIRTLGTGYPVRQISNLVPSTTRPPLRASVKNAIVQYQSLARKPVGRVAPGRGAEVKHSDGVEQDC